MTNISVLICHVRSSLFCHTVSDEEKHFTMTNICCMCLLVTYALAYLIKIVNDSEKYLQNSTQSLILPVVVLANPYCETAHSGL
jgi:hypothetical protein